MILVSACLLGENCKYNGGNNYNKKLEELLKNEEIITICPEKLGGLEVPRLPAEIQGGDGRDVLLGEAKVINNQGLDVTANFILGAKKSFDLIKGKNCSLAILKAKSPSCGSEEIYDGTFSGTKKDGVGVVTAFLEKAGIEVFNEKEVNKIKNKI